MVWLLVACGKPTDPPDPKRSAEPTEAVDTAERTAESSSPTIASASVDPNCPTGFRCDVQHPKDTAADLILVEKRAHKLHLVKGQDVMTTYSVALGSGGQRQKSHEGDKTTPVGRYRVIAIIKGTRWHTYLALDYPSPEDVARYERLVAAGAAPAKVGAGSGIAIHGRRADMRDGVHKLYDWTLGCVALDNPEIDAVAARVSKGTPVEIRE